jgi:hypothetical protein
MLPPLHGADSALEISGDFFPGIENVSIGDNFIHESRTSHAHDSIAREGLAADTNQGTILGNMRGGRNTDIPANCGHLFPAGVTPFLHL